MRGLVFVLFLSLAGSGAATLPHAMERDAGHCNTVQLAGPDPACHTPNPWVAAPVPAADAFGGVGDPRSGPFDSADPYGPAKRPAARTAAASSGSRPVGAPGYAARLNHPPYFPTAPPASG